MSNRADLKLNQSLHDAYLNSFRKSTFFGSQILNIGTVLILLWLGFSGNQGVAIGIGIVWMIFGYLCWTLFEYLTHRFVFHEDAYLNHKIRYLLHGIHHAKPHDTLLIPFYIRIPLLILLFGAFYLLFGSYTFLVYGGFILGFTCYSILHYLIHTIPAPKSLEKIWNHHLSHHYSTPDKAFGTTTLLWDRMFNTSP